MLNQALKALKALTPPRSPTTSIGAQLQQIAQIVNVRGALGMNRQIFFANLGGFDTHDLQLNNQASGLQQLSQALNALFLATQEMGVDREVMTFTESDFGRTFQPSGGATLGTDHAWGSHHFIMGGGVKGGDLYGTFPTLATTGPDDANTRGVWIPTTSLDQYGATLASWFGVSAAGLGQVFPNLTNFTTPSTGVCVVRCCRKESRGADSDRGTALNSRKRPLNFLGGNPRSAAKDDSQTQEYRGQQYPSLRLRNSGAA